MVTPAADDERDEGVQALMPARFEPTIARCRVLGERDAVPTSRFGRRRDVRDRARIEQVDGAPAGFGVLQDDAHRSSVLSDPPVLGGPGCSTIPTDLDATLDVRPGRDLEDHRTP